MKFQFDPHTLLGRFVFVDGVPGKDKVPRTREGFIQGVIETPREKVEDPVEYSLEISLYAGTAEQNQIVTVQFNSKYWRIRFPGPREKKA